MVYPDGSEVHYAYDAAGRLAGVTDAEGSALATYAYDDDGRMATHTVGGTLATGAYRYNTRDWVTGIDYPGRFTLSQAYDAVGNVNSQRYRRAATEAMKAASFTYDGLHRLKTFSLGTAHARSYAGGDRLAKVAGGAVSYYLKDHLGSTRTLLSPDGNAASTYDYWPYGEVLATSGTDATPFKFTGHERDSESGLDFMQYRTYGAEHLRFLQTDPLGLKDPEFSYYVYTGNNPVNRIDHYGLESSDVNGGGEVDIYEMEPVTVWGQRHYNHLWFDRAWGARFDVEIQGSPYFNTVTYNRARRVVRSGVEYGAPGISAIEIGIQRYANLSSIDDLIDHSPRLYVVYRDLGAARRVLGPIGQFASIASLGYDFHAMQTGKISVGRFTYTAVGFGSSAATGYLVAGAFGGPPGILAGAAVGLVFWGGEAAYDYLEPKLNMAFYRLDRGLKQEIYMKRIP